MKVRHIIICTFLGLFGFVQGQEVDLTELKTPSSPAFTILGVQPTEIARPTSFSAFKANVFESLNGAEGISIPQNIAIEFTPYWLVPHPNLSFEDLTKADDIGQNILVNSSVSIATLDLAKETASIVTGTRMGVGYRTLIFKGSPSQENREKLNQALLEKRQLQEKLAIVITPLFNVLATEPVPKDSTDLKMKISEEMNTYFRTQQRDKEEERQIRELVQEIVIPLLLDGINGQESEAAFLAEVGENLRNTLFSDDTNLDKKLKEKAAEIEELIADSEKEYKGFFLEFATAFVLDFPDKEFGNSNIPKWGVWATPSYRTHDDSFEFLGVIRYLENDTFGNTATTNVDLGAKIAFQKGKFSLSGEYINRFQNATFSEILDDGTMAETDESNRDIKAVLNIEYKLGNNILLTYTFGQNFDMNTEINGNVISTVGISYELGGKKFIKDFPL